MAAKKNVLIGPYAVMVLFSFNVLTPGGSSYATAGTLTILDAPGAVYTHPYGIDGDNIVGVYWYESGPSYGFLYNGSNWTTLSMPEGDPVPFGIDGSNIVGSYYDNSDNNHHGFLCDGSTWTTLDMHGINHSDMALVDISGSNIVGWYYGGTSDWTSYKYHSFLYDGATWTNLDMPGADATYVSAISGNNIVGSYQSVDDPFHAHGFIYDGLTWATIDAPGAENTNITGTDGDNIVGYYNASIPGNYGNHGFLYNITSLTWITFEIPGGGASSGLWNISGNNAVGYYFDGSDYKEHGFIYAIPEPATISLLALGGLMLRRRRM